MNTGAPPGLTTWGPNIGCVVCDMNTMGATEFKNLGFQIDYARSDIVNYNKIRRNPNTCAKSLIRVSST